MSEEKLLPDSTTDTAKAEAGKVEVAENKVSTAVDSLVDKGLDDDAPIEADGDVFWTIQRLFWGIIKSVVVLGGILLLLWFIWRPDTALFEQLEKRQEAAENETPVASEPVSNQATEEKVPTKTDSEGWFSGLFNNPETVNNQEPVTVDETPTEPVEQTPVVPVDPVTVTTEDPGIGIAYELENQRLSHTGTTIPRAVEWLKRAKNIGEVSLEVVRIREPNARAARIEEVLQMADRLFSDSIEIQQQLITERDQLLAEGQTYNQTTSTLDANLKSQIAALETGSIESLLAQKIESQQLAVYYMGQARLRDTLLRNVQNFDQLLRQRSIPLLSPATELRAR